jgi:hypothetical protein
MKRNSRQRIEERTAFLKRQLHGNVCLERQFAARVSLHDARKQIACLQRDGREQQHIR